MREILFKAKRIDNGEWVEGFLFHCLNNGEEWCIGNEPLSANDYSEIIGEYRTWFSIDESTICQYTGLTDKNGKKIWENDVVIVNERYKGKVIWSEIWTNYMVIGNGNINISIHNRWDDVYEVIGNAFDNPELLEGEQP